MLALILSQIQVPRSPQQRLWRSSTRCSAHRTCSRWSIRCSSSSCPIWSIWRSWRSILEGYSIATPSHHHEQLVHQVAITFSALPLPCLLSSSVSPTSPINGKRNAQFFVSFLISHFCNYCNFKSERIRRTFIFGRFLALPQLQSFLLSFLILVILPFQYSITLALCLAVILSEYNTQWLVLSWFFHKFYREVLISLITMRSPFCIFACTFVIEEL